VTAGATQAVAARLHHRPLWLAIGWSSIALVVYLSLTTDPLPSGEALGVDFAHAAAYAWLMFWFAQLHVARGTRLVLAGAFCALGATLELMQGYSGYRVFSYVDMRDDAIGVALGWWVATTRLSALLPRLDAWLAPSDSSA
jgi:VanZ family protein